MEQLHLLLNNNVLSSIVDKVQNMFKEKFFDEIANSTKLNYPIQSRQRGI